METVFNITLFIRHSGDRKEIAMSIEVEWARMTAPELRAIAAREGALAILRGLAGAAWSASACHHRHRQRRRRFDRGRPVGRQGSEAGAGRRAARPLVGIK
jgi:hypothetical protein